MLKLRFMPHSFNLLSGPLFEAVQMGGIFSDSKTFVDCIPKRSLEEISKAYSAEHAEVGFDLKAFVRRYFKKPASPATHFKADTSRPIEEHINLLWDVLIRGADTAVQGSSLIPLPHPYVVPGGRFREIYYWDSYFTLLGLQSAGRTDMIQSMVDNFSFLIKTIGFIPNGNRTYFLGRSQPPFYSLMVSLLAEEKGEEVFVKYLPYLEREYNFWMDGHQDLTASVPAQLRVVRIEEGLFLNRYWDNRPLPREESWREDVELAAKSGREVRQLYQDLRAACESGWDFSSRWFRDGRSLATVRTTEILPLDLNALLYHHELMLSKAYQQAGNPSEQYFFERRAATRLEVLTELCWNSREGWFQDFDFVKRQQTGRISAAVMFPLFFKMANGEQAYRTANFVEQHLLRPGGVVTTPNRTGQQWDAPNGWAPLQWVTIAGLRNYDFDLLAEMIRSRWIDLNQKVYRNTGKMMEKYNVEDLSLCAGGGEYPVQDGFGWSNGVLLKLLSEG